MTCPGVRLIIEYPREVASCVYIHRNPAASILVDHDGDTRNCVCQAHRNLRCVAPIRVTSCSSNTPGCHWPESYIICGIVYSVLEPPSLER